MKIIVPIKFVPDLVEELTIAESGNALDEEWMDLILNEFDDHAIEQAILLKERGGGHVTVISLDVEGADDVLATAVAKGADQLIKLVVEPEMVADNHGLAHLLADVIQAAEPDIVLTGVQAHNDLDGQLGPLLAENMGLPYVGYVAGLTAVDGKAIVLKEYPGGLLGEIEVVLPAVFGVQAAESPPRYVAFSRIRQAMKTADIEEKVVARADRSDAIAISRLFQPQIGDRAQMITGEVDEIARHLLRIMADRGIL
jgi:electron transfer flavoprotein beta subunit